jgi:hypothetical protein
MKKLPSQEFLRSCLMYNPDTGVFFSRITGKSVGSVHKSGYIRLFLFVDGKYSEYRASRIAWKIVTGKDPSVYIDHINGDPSDNRFCNLREADESENNYNSRKKGTTSTTYKGVFKQKNANGTEYKTWSFEVRFRGIRYRAGGFKTEEEAYQARCAMAKLLHGEFFNDGNPLVIRVS